MNCCFFVQCMLRICIHVCNCRVCALFGILIHNKINENHMLIVKERCVQGLGGRGGGMGEILRE